MHTPRVQQPQSARQQPSAQTAISKREWSLRTHLLVFGLALLLPILTLTIFLLVKINNSNRAELDERMVQVAAGLAAEIDREIQRRVTILQTLATSPALARGDFGTFHAYASAVLHEEKTGIFLIDAKSLQQLLNTYISFGTQLPTYGSPNTAQRVLETKRWQVSDFFVGRVSKRPALDIDLPILKDGEIQYLLVMGLEPFMFQEIVRAQNFPEGWIINVADRNGTIIVRSTDQDKYVGTKLTPELLAQQAGSVTRIASLEGVAVLRSTATSRLSGWQVAINVPASGAEAPLREGFFFLGLWGLAALLLTALIAGWFARRMTMPIVIAADAAADLAHRRVVPAFQSHVSEANKLIDAIKGAAQDLSNADETRRAAEAQQRSAYRQLEAEKTQTETLLRQREAIFLAMPNGLLVIDYDGRIRLLNEQLARKFGYRQDELLDKNVEMLVPERFRGHHAALRQTFTAAPSTRPMGAGRDLFGLRKDGTEFPIEIGLSPFAVDGRDMVLAIVIDIGARKRAEYAAAQSAARQAALYALSDRLHRADTLPAIYDAALDTMEQALHCDRASILLQDEPGVMRFASWRGLSADYRRAMDGHSPWAMDEPDPQPIYVSNITTADIDERLKRSITTEGIYALAFIPLMSTGKLLGKFTTYYNKPHVFSHDEQDISLTIARQLALSIERKQTDDSLRESEHRLELALSAGRMGAWEWHIRTGRMFWSPGIEKIRGGQPGALGRTFDTFKSDIHPDDQERVLAEVWKAVETKQDYHVLYRLKLSGDGSVRWVESFGRLTVAPDGTAQSMAGVAIDITERKRAEETEKLLSAELQHRTKNLFAVVQALAMRSLRGDQTLDQAREAFVGRLQALARSDARLTQSSWGGASLIDVVKSELNHCADRVEMSGHDIILTPQAAQNFALAIHELSTNAAKYGSLSKPGGEIIISWATANNESGEVLQFRWQETGGPTVTTPKRKGFGTSLLESTLGKGRVEYKSDGLIYEIELPLAAITPGGGQLLGETPDLLGLTRQQEQSPPTILKPI